MSTLELPNEIVSPAIRAKLMLMGMAAILAISSLLLTFWGWADWRSFFAHPARCVVLVVLILRFAHGMFTSHPNTIGRGQCDKRVSERSFFTLLIASGLIVTASPYFDARGLWVLGGGDATRYAGLLLFVFGMGLSHWAVLHMGRLFSGHVTLQENHKLITDGPFTHIRHPRYLGHMLLFLGIALVFRSSAGAAAAAFFTVLFLTRIPREEALMAREFGTEWTAYTRRTRSLLPGLF